MLLWTTIYQWTGQPKKIDKSLEIQNLPKPKHNKEENLNRLTASKETESVISTLWRNKSPSDGFTGEFYQTFKELMWIIFKLF